MTLLDKPARAAGAPQVVRGTAGVRGGRAALLALIVAASLGAACGAGARGGGGPGDPRLGAVLDDAWPLVDGRTLELAALAGQIVVIHVFTTWSIAADQDLVELRAARALSPAHVTLVSLGLDPDGAALLLPWRDAAGCDWLVAMPTPDVLAGHSALGDVMAVVPRTVVLDRGGRVAWQKAGVLSPGELVAAVRVALARK